MRSTTRPPERRRVAIAAAGTALAGLALSVWLSASQPDAPIAAPPPAPEPPLAPVAATPATAPPTPSAEGLRLYGLLGRGAIIGEAGGSQRFVAIGREVRPGLRVERIEPQFVVLAATSGEVRLGFDGPRRGDAGTAAPAAAGGVEASGRDETTAYRLGLAPRRAGGSVSGYVVRPGVSMPALERAGLRPGDVILGVNGSRFDEERLLELAWQIDNSERTEFEVERGGQRMRLSLGRPIG
ncbi:MAG: hypothetical protein ACXWUX_13500 [Allosphingosinicella sp.]